MMSLYIHIPFCKSKCKYCTFYSKSAAHSEYVSALLRCIEYYGKIYKKPLETLYIGGGTPSILSILEFEKILGKIHSQFDTKNIAEATVECNPESVSLELFETLKALGINRISMGVQSFDDGELSAIGRLHTAKQALDAIELAKSCGFENISCDLIFGLPYQTEKSFEKSLETLVNTGVSHISCYNLQLEEGSALFKEKIPVPDEIYQEKMYYLACSYLKDRGYEHYEVSNFAKSGKKAVHNGRYWDGSDYIGLGPSAHSKIGDIRAFFDADTYKFIQKTDFDFDGKERIDDPLFEKIMLTLRTNRGLEKSLLPKSSAYIQKLCESGFAKDFGDTFALTDRGFYLSNTIISDITAKEC